MKSETEVAPRGGLLLSQRILFWLLGLLLLAVLAFIVWAGDHVSMKGQRTIYTARCLSGSWQGNLCAGHLGAGERYRFLALKAHGEVLYWMGESPAASGKFSDCVIRDGRNWRCRPTQAAPPTITHEMRQGRGVPEDQTISLEFHAIPKWKWFILKLGLPAGKEADN